VLKGVAELAQVGVGGRTLSAPSAAVKPSMAWEKAASVTAGGSGLVETTSAWLMTLSSSQEA
jgi:hypothetical protein